MAETGADQPLLLMMYDWNEGDLFYGVRLETVASADDEPPAPEIRLTPTPVARFTRDDHKCSAFAVSGGGRTIVGLVADSRDTVIHDTVTGATTRGPRLRDPKRHPAMLPVGDATVVVMDMLLHRSTCCFEALRRGPDGVWRADTLPEPPAEHLDDDCDDPYDACICVSAYFAVGTRAWITVADEGTFSLDTDERAGGAWRMEGPWEVPLYQHGLFVPEFGAVIGIPREGFDSGLSGDRSCHVCALDVEAGRPPAMRHVWEFPAERVEGKVDVPLGWGMVSLAYLGNGRLCVARSVTLELSTVRGVTCKGTGTSFTLVDVTRLPCGEIDITKRGKVHYHQWPFGHSGHARFLQPAAAT